MIESPPRGVTSALGAEMLFGVVPLAFGLAIVSRLVDAFKDCNETALRTLLIADWMPRSLTKSLSVGRQDAMSARPASISPQYNMVEIVTDEVALVKLTQLCGRKGLPTLYVERGLCGELHRCNLKNYDQPNYGCNKGN